MIEDMSKDEWNKLRQLLIKETQLQKEQSILTEIPECLFLILMSRNFIKMRKKVVLFLFVLVSFKERKEGARVCCFCSQDQRMDFSLLVSCLKVMEMYYWADQLKYLENLVNSEAGYGMETDAKNVVLCKLPSSRFNLDPKNPGTILIFNVENYENKVISIE